MLLYDILPARSAKPKLPKRGMQMNEPAINTHLRIDRRLCGSPIRLDEGASTVEMTLTDEMLADDSGLVHGGFIFGLADYAAMLAVNHPNVVLGKADVVFLKPARSGERLRAEARVGAFEGGKRTVAVDVYRNGERVFTGTMICVVPERHVLEGAP